MSHPAHTRALPLLPWGLTLLALAALAACEGGCEDEAPWDEDQLAAHRRAVPRLAWLRMDHPEVEPGPGVATWPQQTGAFAAASNATLENFLGLVQALIEREPERYDAARKTFFWGPFPNEMTVIPDDVLIISVQRTGVTPARGDAGLDAPGAEDAAAEDAGAAPGPEAAFAYVTRFDRVIEGDASTRFTYMWAGTNPSPGGDGRVEGVVVWDFEANWRFETAHDPVVLRLERGRLALLYQVGARVTAAGGAADAGAGELERRTVAGAFRGFLMRSARPEEQPADFDYLWGAARGPDLSYGFIDLQLMGDIDPSGTTAAEAIHGRMCNQASGAGRIEAQAVGGDLPAGFHADLVECWDQDILQQHQSSTLVHDLGMVPPQPLAPPVGSPTDCSVSTLEPMPTLADLPQALLPAYLSGAEQGTEAFPLAR